MAAFQLNLKYVFVAIALFSIAIFSWQLHRVAELEKEKTSALLHQAPDYYWKGSGRNVGDPVSLVKVVNHLHGMGKTKAIAAMRLHDKVSGEFPYRSGYRLGVTTNVVVHLFERPSSPCKFAHYWDRPLFHVDHDLVWDSHDWRMGSTSGTDPKLIDWAEAHGSIRADPMTPPDDPFKSAETALRVFEKSEKSGFTYDYNPD